MQDQAIDTTSDASLSPRLSLQLRCDTTSSPPAMAHSERATSPHAVSPGPGDIAALKNGTGNLLWETSREPASFGPQKPPTGGSGTRAVAESPSEDGTSAPLATAMAA